MNFFCLEGHTHQNILYLCVANKSHPFTSSVSYVLLQTITSDLKKNQRIVVFESSFYDQRQYPQTWI